MTIVLALIVLVIFIIGIVVLVNIVRDEVADNLRRQRMAAEVAKATSKLRRLEHNAMRQMHDATKPFIDVDGSER